MIIHLKFKNHLIKFKKFFFNKKPNILNFEFKSN